MREYLKFYINGERVDPVQPKSLDVINPADESVCARISLGSEADVDKAVAAAKAAFETYGYSTREERIAVMERVVETYKKRYQDMADAIRTEMGAPKSLAEADQAYSGQGHLEKALEVRASYV